jgi:hypothetical protein
MRESSIFDVLVDCLSLAHIVAIAQSPVHVTDIPSIALHLSTLPPHTSMPLPLTRVLRPYTSLPLPFT